MKNPSVELWNHSSVAQNQKQVDGVGHLLWNPTSQKRPTKKHPKAPNPSKKKLQCKRHNW